MAPRGWWHIVAKFLQCLQFPAWEQPLSPAWGRLRFPAWEHCQCLAWARLQSLPGTLASSLPGNAFQFPAWERLPVPCLGTLASVHALPGHACSPCMGRLPVPCLGTFACALPEHVLQSLPGTLCQFPAWEHLPMPCLGMFASPCLGMLFSGTLSLCSFLMLICASSSLICHAPFQNNDSKKTFSLVCHASSKIMLK